MSVKNLLSMYFLSVFNYWFNLKLLVHKVSIELTLFKLACAQNYIGEANFRYGNVLNSFGKKVLLQTFYIVKKKYLPVNVKKNK